MLSILGEHLLKFHACKDAKSLREPINNIFGGNKESKKIQKTILNLAIQNIAFVSSQNTDNTNKSVSAVTSVSAASKTVLVYALPNVDTLSDAVVFAAKLPILNTNEFDLWKMRKEQYFLMTDYSLWEVILNGDSLIPTRVIDGVVQPVASTTINNPVMRKYCFMMEAIEKQFGGNKETKKASEAYQPTGNFGAVTSVFAASTKVPVSALPNMDTLNADDLEEMDLKWQMAMLTSKEGILQGSAGHLRTPGIQILKGGMFQWRLLLLMHWFHSVMVLVAMTRAFRQMKNQKNMPSWHSPPQVLLVLIMSTTKPYKDVSQSNSSSAPIIEGWVSDSEDESEEINRGYVAFGGNPKGGKITDTESIVLSYDFKMPDENHETLDESNIWHRRLGHINFKTMNKLVKGNLVRGLPSKVFENNHTYVACKKGKQHRASCNFDGKADEGFLVGYSVSSKAFRVFNSRTRIVQETLHVNFLENQSNVTGSGPTWLFDIDTFTQSMNYQLVIAGNQPNSIVGIQEHFDADKAGEGNVQQYVLFPLWSSSSKDPQNTDANATFKVKEPKSEVHVSLSSSAKIMKNDNKTKREDQVKSHVELSTGVRNLCEEFEDFFDNNINGVNAASTPVNTFGQNSSNSTNTFSAVGPYNTGVSPTLRKSSYVDSSQYLDDPDMPALENITYSNDEEDVGVEDDFSNFETNINVSHIPTTRVHKDHPVTQIIGNLSLAPQTKSMTRMVKEQGRVTCIINDDFHTCMFACFLSQEELKRVHQALKDPSWIEAIKEELLQFKMQKEKGIDYEEVFAPVARIEAIRTFKEEVYVCQPPGFENPDYPDKRGKIDQTLFIKKQKVKQKVDEIFISQDKYVPKILRKFGLTDEKLASTPIDTEKPLLKDPDGEDVDIHTYKSMIGSLMYLTSSRPDVMSAICTCARFQVTPKASHLHAVKRIFRYLKGKLYLGLWYPKDSPFNLVTYSDSDYAGASLDRKSTTGGCQFLGCRLIFWQCKKQTIVATSSTEAEYTYLPKLLVLEDFNTYLQVLDS
nr:hypothetical protein [Tanacetum cinerariifolium]